MSKRQRSKHDFSIAKASPRSAKKMKVSSRLRRHKQETRQDSSKVTSAYISPECSLKLPAGHSPICSTPRTSRQRFNTSHSESETEIIWDGNSPTAHLQRRVGRSGHSKAGDISEIVQCVNNQAASNDKGPPDMPLLGLWMTRSPGCPAVDLGVARKSQGGLAHESSKPKTTNSKKKTSGRLSLLQAELEKIASAINMAPSYDDNRDIQAQHEESIEERNKQDSPTHTDSKQASMRDYSQSAPHQLNSDQAVSTRTSTGQHATNLGKATIQLTTGPCLTDRSDSCKLVIAQADTTQKISEAQASTSQSTTGLLGFSLTKSGTIVGQSKICKPVTCPSNSGHCSGQSETCQSTTSQYSQSKIGQTNSGQTSWAVTGQLNSAQFITAVSGKDGFNTRSNTRPMSSHLATGQLASARSKSGQTNPYIACQPNAGQPITTKSSVGRWVPSLSKTGNTVSGQLNIGVTVTGQSHCGQSNVGQFMAHSKSGQSFMGQSGPGSLVTSQSKVGYSGTGQVFTGQSISGKIVTGKSTSGPVISQSDFKQSAQNHLNSAKLATPQSKTDIPAARHSKTDNLVTPQPSISQSGATGVSTRSSTNLVSSHFTTGQVASSEASTNKPTNVRPNYGLVTSQAVTSHCVSSQLTTGRPLPVKTTSGQITVTKNTSAQSIPNPSQTKHSVACHTHKSLHQSNKPQTVDSHSHTNHQNNSKSAQPSVNENEILWDDDSYFEDETLLEQLSQTEALEMSRSQCSQAATDSKNHPDLPAIQPCGASLHVKIDPNGTSKQGQQIYQTPNCLDNKPVTVSASKASQGKQTQMMVKHMPLAKTVVTTSANWVKNSKALSSQHIPFAQHLPVHCKSPAAVVDTSLTFSIPGNRNSGSVKNHREKLPTDKNQELDRMAVFPGQVSISNSSVLHKPNIATPSKQIASRPTDLDASDLFESSLTDEMMMSLCAGMDSPQAVKPSAPVPAVQQPTNTSVPSAVITNKNHSYRYKFSSSKGATGQARPLGSNLQTTTTTAVSVIPNQIQEQQQNKFILSSKTENITSHSINAAPGNYASRPDLAKSRPATSQACQPLVLNHEPPATKPSSHSSKLVVSAPVAPAPIRGGAPAKMTTVACNQENIVHAKSHPTTTVTSAVKGSSQRVCSQTEIERKRQEAMARRGNRVFSYS